MTITRYIYSDKKYKQRLLDIQKKYSENSFYIDNPKKFSQLVILIEDFPKDYLQKIETTYQYFDVKQWIQDLFIVEKTSAIPLTIENEIQFILNNITVLPFCKCNVKLKMLKKSME